LSCIILVDELRQQVEEIKSVMNQNIEQVLYRGERLDTLELKAEELESQAQQFQVKIHTYVCSICSHATS